MLGTLTTIRTERKPVVLWTPWGAIPKAASQARQGKGRVKLHNARDAAVRADGRQATRFKLD